MSAKDPNCKHCEEAKIIARGTLEAWATMKTPADVSMSALSIALAAMTVEMDFPVGAVIAEYLARCEELGLPATGVIALPHEKLKELGYVEPEQKPAKASTVN